MERVWSSSSVFQSSWVTAGWVRQHAPPGQIFGVIPAARAVMAIFLGGDILAAQEQQGQPVGIGVLGLQQFRDRLQTLAHHQVLRRRVHDLLEVRVYFQKSKACRSPAGRILRCRAPLLSGRRAAGWRHGGHFLRLRRCSWVFSSNRPSKGLGRVRLQALEHFQQCNRNYGGIGGGIRPLRHRPFQSAGRSSGAAAAALGHPGSRRAPTWPTRRGPGVPGPADWKPPA